MVRIPPRCCCDISVDIFRYSPFSSCVIGFGAISFCSDRTLKNQFCAAPDASCNHWLGGCGWQWVRKYIVGGYRLAHGRVYSAVMSVCNDNRWFRAGIFAAHVYASDAQKQFPFFLLVKFPKNNLPHVCPCLYHAALLSKNHQPPRILASVDMIWISHAFSCTLPGSKSKKKYVHHVGQITT